MATNKHATVRYIALDRCFSNYHHRYTFEDLKEACKEALAMEYGDDTGISTRTLREDIRFMKSEEGWRAPIIALKGGGTPYYTYEDREFTIKKQKLNSVETEQLKNTLITLSRFKGLPQFDWMNEIVARLEGGFELKSNIPEVVGFEQNPYLRGLEHFDGLFKAVSNKRALEIVYHPAFGDADIFIVHPYYLKQYNNRWFLFGANENKIMNMALDRIESFKEVDCAYIDNETINFNEYFEDVVGVSVPTEKVLETIVLRVDRKRYNYIDSKPLHPSQTVIKSESTDDYVTIQLEVIRNYEFDTLLLGFADSIDIIEPVLLREDIKTRANNILQKNK